MDVTELTRFISETFDGTNVVEGNADLYFIYDPGRDLPDNRQHPFATIMTADRYDNVSALDRPGAFRLNIGLTKATYTARFGTPPTARDEHGILETGYDYAVTDRVMPHPIYASQYWVCVVNPGETTANDIGAMLAEAHDFAARKYTNHRARQAG
jgi:hypothetical protein